jgi:hypothetical protein
VDKTVQNTFRFHRKNSICIPHQLDYRHRDIRKHPMTSSYQLKRNKLHQSQLVHQHKRSRLRHTHRRRLCPHRDPHIHHIRLRVPYSHSHNSHQRPLCMLSRQHHTSHIRLIGLQRSYIRRLQPLSSGGRDRCIYRRHPVRLFLRRHQRSLLLCFLHSHSSPLGILLCCPHMGPFYINQIPHLLTSLQDSHQ